MLSKGEWGSEWILCHIGPNESERVQKMSEHVNGTEWVRMDWHRLLNGSWRFVGTLCDVWLVAAPLSCRPISDDLCPLPPVACLLLPIAHALIINSPGPWPQGVWDQELSFVLLNSIAMTIKVLPGAFGLELCPANRCQTTPQIYQHL